jgi:dTMP kinase
MPLFKRSKKSKIPQKGKFIVIDGIDGSGKSTQLQFLKEELELSGYKTETIHFPQHGTPSAVMVDYYLEGRYGQLNPFASSIFYAVDRFDASEKIRAWINEGKIVLSDRYVTANAGHQGSKISDDLERLKFFKWLDNLEYNIFNIPKPDLNIILNIPAEEAVKLLKSRKGNPKHEDNMHEKSLQHLQGSQKVYRQISKLFPNTKMVECMAGGKILNFLETHNKVWEFVRRIALKDFKP